MCDEASYRHVFFWFYQWCIIGRLSKFASVSEIISKQAVVFNSFFIAFLNNPPDQNKMLICRDGTLLCENFPLN